MFPGISVSLTPYILSFSLIKYQDPCPSNHSFLYVNATSYFTENIMFNKGSPFIIFLHLQLFFYLFYHKVKIVPLPFLRQFLFLWTQSSPLTSSGTLYYLSQFLCSTLNFSKCFFDFGR